MKITFTELTPAHFYLLHTWLNAPHVRQWWGKSGATLEQIEQKYMPRISGAEPACCFICSLEVEGNAEPIGYIQTYRLVDYLDYSQQFAPDIDESVLSTDLYIGDSRYLHQGLGQIILKQFLQEYIFGKMKASMCMIGPDIENKRAIKAYEKVGFRHWQTVAMQDGTTEYLMKLEQSDFRDK